MCRIESADPFSVPAANSLPVDHNFLGVELQSVGVRICRQGYGHEGSETVCEPWACLAFHKTPQVVPAAAFLR